MQLSTNVVGSATNMANTINSSQPQPSQYLSEAQYNETTTHCPAVSAAYSVEISKEGASLNSQTSQTSEAATLKHATGSAKDAQLPSMTQQAEISSEDNGPSPAYSVEISAAGRQLNASKSVASESATDNGDSSASSTESLSQYSDSQLQQMLSNGDISQSEYNTEMAKRKNDGEAEKLISPE